MKKPNLFIVGAPKCGTTAWREYLGTHPEIFFSTPKEPHYFNEDHTNFRWYREEDEYLSLFADTDHHKYSGECSVMYFYSRVAAENLRAFNPSAKIMVFLRPPLSFLPSFHNELLYGHHEQIRDFSVAWDKWSTRRNGQEVPSTCLEPNFLDYQSVASFGVQLERLFASFPREQVHVVWFDEWTRDPSRTYDQIMDFLDLVSDGRTDFHRIHEARRHRSSVLARMTQRPGPILRGASRLLRKSLGRKRLRLAARIREANKAPAITVRPRGEFASKIAKSLEEDTRLLESLTGRSLTKWLK